MSPFSVSQIVAARHSVREFLSKPVDLKVVKECLLKASRAPSGGNVQPWLVHVVSGDVRDAIVADVAKDLAAGKFAQGTEYDIYPPGLSGSYKKRRTDCGNQMYTILDVKRSDTKGKIAHLAKNWEFFGAPVGVFFTVDRQMGAPQWSDIGGFLQTFMLLLKEKGIDTCAQEAWAQQHLTVRKHLKLPEHEMLFCGMAVGYADESKAINSFKTERDLDFITFHGGESKL